MENRFAWFFSGHTSFHIWKTSWTHNALLTNCRTKLVLKLLILFYGAQLLEPLNMQIYCNNVSGQPAVSELQCGQPRLNRLTANGLNHHMQSDIRHSTKLTIKYLSWPRTWTRLIVYCGSCSLLRVFKYCKLRPSNPCRKTDWNNKNNHITNY